MKDIGTYLLTLAATLIIIILTIRAWDTPIVMKDRDGKVCGCILPGHEVPHLNNCKYVDFNKSYDLYPVSHCD